MTRPPAIPGNERELANDMMKLALRLARKAQGRTRPNPMVGAVVSKGRRVLGVGYHQRVGLAHAEVEALENAGKKAQGADLFVTLEPCHCHGRTGPCVERILRSGIRRVFVGAEDPNPRECGESISFLRRQGLKVFEGVLEEECRTLNEAYNVYIRERRPFVRLKVAVSLDGRLATESGESRWISSEPSRRRVHRMRSRSDAILVGAGTVRKDDPLLDVRMTHGRVPAVVLLDTRLSISPGARVFGVKRSAPLWIYCSSDASDSKRKVLERLGARIVRMPVKKKRLRLKPVLSDLLQKGVYELMVEGGSEIIGSFLSERLVDRLDVFIAPRLLGSNAVPFARFRGPKEIAKTLWLQKGCWTRSGADAHFSGIARWNG
jgi:diaminohydroxyphosphoribosylaminopyrimidine deaminase / 5-amino-6-(5-phosphoribosylamino)uracil reductase